MATPTGPLAVGLNIPPSPWVVPLVNTAPRVNLSADPPDDHDAEHPEHRHRPGEDHQ